MAAPTSAPVAATPWGQGEPIAGTPFRQLITGAQTDGRLVVLTVDMPAGEQVDEHTHELEDQIIIIISGTVEATVGGTEMHLDAGSVCFMPRGVPHALCNAGTKPARVVDMYTPSGFEKVFQSAGARGLTA